MFFCKIDQVTGLWLEDTIHDAPPVNDTGEHDPTYIAVPCPEGFYLPRWDGGRWVEGKTPQEIAVAQGISDPQKSTEEKLDELAANVTDAMTAIMVLSIE